MSKRILIFGGSGLLGAELLTQISDAMVFSTFRTKAETKTEKDFVFAISEENNWEKDLEKILAKTKPDVVVNPLAMTNVDACILHPKQALLVNTIFPKKLTELLNPNQKLIHISTDFVFRGDNSSFYKVDETVCPVNYYAYTKHLAEQIILEKENPNWVIARTALVFGKDKQKPNYLFKFADWLKEKKPLKVVYDHRRTPTDVRDLAKGVRQMIAKEKWQHPIYHLTGKEAIFFYDWIMKLAETLNLSTENIEKVHSETLQAPAIRPAQTPLDISVSEAEFGYSPRTLVQSLQDYFSKD